MPIIKNTASSYSFRLPNSFSAIAAHFASFSRCIGTSKCFFIFSTTSKLSIPKFSAFITAVSDTVPGKAIPMLSISSFFTLLLSIFYLLAQLLFLKLY